MKLTRRKTAAGSMWGCSATNGPDIECHCQVGRVLNPSRLDIVDGSIVLTVLMLIKSVSGYPPLRCECNLFASIFEILVLLPCCQSGPLTPSEHCNGKLCLTSTYDPAPTSSPLDVLPIRHTLPPLDLMFCSICQSVTWPQELSRRRRHLAK